MYSYPWHWIEMRCQLHALPVTSAVASGRVGLTAGLNPLCLVSNPGSEVVHLEAYALH
jgi:hypothetical protein